jgi:hypothetical protein
MNGNFGFARRFDRAFLCMNLPYTMGVAEAAQATAAFNPITFVRPPSALVVPLLIHAIGNPSPSSHRLDGASSQCNAVPLPQR